jgi:hypothetical protein
MDDLIARLSAGERWDHDNADVLNALGYSHRWVGGEVISTHKGDKLFVNRGLFPLSSVDDALRLVPPLWWHEEAGQTCDNGDWYWCLHRDGDVSKIGRASGEGPTAAVALTIAILEASRG